MVFKHSGRRSIPMAGALFLSGLLVPVTTVAGYPSFDGFIGGTAGGGKTTLNIEISGENDNSCVLEWTLRDKDGNVVAHKTKTVQLVNGSYSGQWVIEDVEAQPGQTDVLVVRDPLIISGEEQPGKWVAGGSAVRVPQTIPAVSEWGAVVMMLLVLAAGTVVIRRRRALRTAV